MKIGCIEEPLKASLLKWKFLGIDTLLKHVNNIIIMEHELAPRIRNEESKREKGNVLFLNRLHC